MIKIMSQLNDLFRIFRPELEVGGGGLDANTQSLGIGSLILSEKNEGNSIKYVLEYDSEDEEDLITKILVYLTKILKVQVSLLRVLSQTVFSCQKHGY